MISQTFSNPYDSNLSQYIILMVVVWKSILDILVIVVLPDLSLKILSF